MGGGTIYVGKFRSKETAVFTGGVKKIEEG
jgi:hypothetical protein